MAIRIYNNISAHTALRYLDSSQKRLGDSIEKLSSGLRINKAGDDPAGLAISEKLRSQIRGVRRAALNAQDGISLLQTAEGALSEVHDMLHRMRELAVQAANDTLTQNDRIEIQREIIQLSDEINRISKATEFNTKPLLDGSASALVSLDNPGDMKAIVRGVVREGNYRVTKQNDPGQAQVLKSDIFNIVSSDKNPRGTRGEAHDFALSTVFQGVGEGFRASDLTSFNNLEFSRGVDSDTNQRRDFQVSVQLITGTTSDQVAVADHSFQTQGGKAGFAIAQTAPTTLGVGDSGYYEVEVSSVYSNEGIIDSTQGSARLYELTVREIDSEGNVVRTAAFDVSHAEAAAASDLLGSSFADMVTAGAVSIQMGMNATKWAVGDKFLLVANANEDFTTGGNQFVQRLAQDTGDNGFQADALGSGVRNDAAEDRVGLFTTLGTDVTAIDGSTYATSLVYYDTSGNRQMGTGDIRYGDAGFTVNAGGGSAEFWMEETSLAERTTLLRDVDKFQGVFGRGGEEISIYNGRGEQAKVVINSSDSMEHVAEKIRDAITRSRAMGGLGMGVDGDLSRLTGVDGNVAVFVTETTVNSDEAVPGTFIIRSTVPGAEGRIVFSATQDILNAFSLAQIRDPIDPMQVTVSDAHTGELIGSTVIDDGVARNVIPGIDLVIDQRIDTQVRFIRAGEVLTPGNVLEGGSAGVTSYNPADIILGASTFAANAFTGFQGLEADTGPVGSPLNTIANFEMATENAGLDQFNVADFRFVNPLQTKAGFAVGAGNLLNGQAAYYELEAVSIDGNTTTGTAITLAVLNGAGHIMGLQARVYDRTGTLLESAFLQVGDGANAGAGIDPTAAQEYFSATYLDGGLTAANGLDIVGGETASVDLGAGGDAYSVGDKIVFALGDVDADVSVNLRNDTTDTGFAGTAYDINSGGVAGSADGGISAGNTAAPVRTGLAEDLGANNFNNVAGQTANVTLTYYDTGGGLTVGGGSVVLGQPGDTIQSGTVDFSLVAETTSGPRFVFDSAPGAVDEFVHVVDNRITLQIGANAGQTLTAEIAQLDSTALGIDNVLVVSRVFAEEALAKIDAAVDEVSSQRARLGALINRLEATHRVLTIQSENLLAAESRIRDLDIAYQTVDFTRDQILVQAGTALLAQANALPQSVLQLLQ